MKNLFKVFLLFSVFNFAYGEDENIHISNIQVGSLPSKFEVFTILHSNSEDHETKLIIRNKIKNKQTELILESIFIKINRIKCFKLGENESPYLVIELTAGVHSAKAYIFNLNKLEAGSIDEISSYYEFEDIMKSPDAGEIHFYGTTYKSMKNEDPVVKTVWKAK